MERASKMTPCDTSVRHIYKIHITMLLNITSCHMNVAEHTILSLCGTGGFASKKGNPLCGLSIPITFQKGYCQSTATQHAIICQIPTNIDSLEDYLEAYWGVFTKILTLCIIFSNRHI